MAICNLVAPTTRSCFLSSNAILRKISDLHLDRAHGSEVDELDHLRGPLQPFLVFRWVFADDDGRLIVVNSVNQKFCPQIGHTKKKYCYR